MKKIVFALWLNGLCFFSYAQKGDLTTPYAVPIDSITRLITYEGVVEVKGTPASILYKRINDWFHSYFVNPTEVIRENDSLKFSIIGKPRFRLANIPSKESVRADAGVVQYTISVAARDGRFKYELTAFNQKQLSYYPCERWLDVKSKTFVPAYNEYLQQLDKYSIGLIGALKKEVMNEKPVKDKDSW